MQILKLLLSFFLKDEKFKTFAPVLELLSKNDFDFRKTLNGLNLDAVAPIIKAFMENLNAKEGQKQTPTDFSVGEVVGLNPIANLADKEIVYTLNKYYS